jgi:hypothetical protein
VTVRLKLDPITIDRDALERTGERDPFDRLALEMLARVGMMSEQIAASVQRASAPRGLTLDQCVVGGLLVRVSKLVRGVFDACQADESEAHLPLGRCAAETAITLRWLVECSNDDSFRRFRADSFAYWRGVFAQMSEASDEDHVERQIRLKLEATVDRELDAAGVTWDDVPRRTNSWGPDMRQRCRDLDQEWLYESLFSSHSSYVHPSWHELRTFHLKSDGGRVNLDPTYGGMAPSTGYVLARVVAESCEAATTFLPSDLDAADVAERVKNTVRASQILAYAFSGFMARGGADDDLGRHAQVAERQAPAHDVNPYEASAAWVRERMTESSAWSGSIVAGSGEHPWADELIRQFNAAVPGLRACPHLQRIPQQPSMWMALAPDLLACRRPECSRQLVDAIEERLGHSLAEEPGRCSICGKPSVVKGVSIVSQATLLRALSCPRCLGDDILSGGGTRDDHES